jgi:hypothetical protein
VNLACRHPSHGPTLTGSSRTTSRGCPTFDFPPRPVCRYAETERSVVPRVGHITSLSPLVLFVPCPHSFYKTSSVLVIFLVLTLLTPANRFVIVPIVRALNPIHRIGRNRCQNPTHRATPWKCTFSLSIAVFGIVTTGPVGHQPIMPLLCTAIWY